MNSKRDQSRDKNRNDSETPKNTKNTPKFEKTRVFTGRHELDEPADEDIIDTEEEHIVLLDTTPFPEHHS